MNRERCYDGTMKHPVRQLALETFPLLKEIPEPPQILYARGKVPDKQITYLAVVGSRKVTSYGKMVVEHLIGGLSGYPICIVSGLALGVDTLAHRHALIAGLNTIAVPGSGLDDSVLYPQSNLSLAHEILEHGGTLLSEYEPRFKATEWSFPRRNRIMAGMSHATLVIEAGEKSGTLITARLATDYNRELLVVPGNIFSENSKGVHQFLKLGATPVTSPDDILDALSITKSAVAHIYDGDDVVLTSLREPQSFEALLESTLLSSEELSARLSQLELDGVISMSSGVIIKK